MHDIRPQLLTGIFNQCLRTGTFPALWKRGRLVLLRKGNKPEGVPSSYRPLCLLNDVGKMLEALRSSSNDREGAGLASQASVIPIDTSAEAVATQGTQQETSNLQRKLLESSSVVKAMAKLKSLVKAQNVLLNSLFVAADTMSVLRQTTRSDKIKESIDGLTELTSKLDSNRKPLHNVVLEACKLVEQAPPEPLRKDFSFAHLLESGLRLLHYVTRGSISNYGHTPTKPACKGKKTDIRQEKKQRARTTGEKHLGYVASRMGQLR